VVDSADLLLHPVRLRIVQRCVRPTSSAAAAARTDLPSRADSGFAGSANGGSGAARWLPQPAGCRKSLAAATRWLPQPAGCRKSLAAASRWLQAPHDRNARAAATHVLSRDAAIRTRQTGGSKLPAN
jgi:hypothetical protein